VPVETPTPLDAEEIAAQIEHGGPFSRYFDNFESRPQQLEMLRAVANALSNSQHFMVEAGTGTGKSFAYLIPAVEWALRNSMRVVISTNTITLQDQLIKKDIPDLANALGSEVRATVVKGRSNYLCPRRFSAMRKTGPENADELRVLAKTLVWLQQGGSGDRGEINLNGPAEREVWQRLSAEDEGCRTEVCVSRMGGACPFYRAHIAAQTSHILVVNHALLLADVMTGNRVLPEYKYLIVDEAHHLESATTNALSFRITQADFTRRLREVGSVSSGLLGRMLTLLSHVLSPSDFASLNMIVHKISDLMFRLENEFGELVLGDIAAMAAYQQREHLLVFPGETGQVGVLDQVGAVLVVMVVGDIQAHFMHLGRPAQQFAPYTVFQVPVRGHLVKGMQGFAFHAGRLFQIGVIALHQRAEVRSRTSSWW